MAKIITSNFGSIHDALNKMIIGEVKAALRLVPGQEFMGPSLCSIVVSDGANYEPKDVTVDGVWLHNDKFYFDGHVNIRSSGYADDNDEPERIEGGEGDEETLETDWLDITDFQYLIEQLKDKMPDGNYDLTNGADLHELDSQAHNKWNY